MPQGQADGGRARVDAKAPQRPATIGLDKKPEPLGMAVTSTFEQTEHLATVVAKPQPPL
jgi:hypothetical protein